MANVFQVPLINPFRFVNTNVYTNADPRYNGLPFDATKDGFMNPNGAYFQKWQTNDYTTFQFQSDFAGATFKLYDFYSDQLVASFDVTLKDTPIVGVTWKVYECTVAFAEIDPGFYYGVLSYVDQDEVTQIIQTSPLAVADYWDKTLLYEYKNTQNDKGIVWDTGIEMSIRVEGLIREYTPKSLREDYVDQPYDAYVLNDIPYRTFKNYIGSAKGLPDWLIDKMNIIFTINALQINGVYYTKESGQVFEVTRPQNGDNENGFASIKIIQNENFNLAQYVTGSTPGNNAFQVIAEQIPYYNNNANIAITGIFKIHSSLIGLAIWNRSAVPLTILVGTTNGGDDIGTFPLTDDVTSWVAIDKVFKEPTDVYITGIEGALLDINVRYDYYDAVTQNGGGSSGGFVPNVEYTYYEFTSGDFVRDWDVATGLGNAGTAFEGCALLDGQNGTINDAGLFRRGYDKLFPLQRQTVQGNADSKVTIPRAALPAEGVEMFTTDVNPTFGDNISTTSNVARSGSTGAGHAGNYDMLKGNIANVPTLGLSADLGDGDPLDITPACLVMARFIKLPS